MHPSIQFKVEILYMQYTITNEYQQSGILSRDIKIKIIYKYYMASHWIVKNVTTEKKKFHEAQPTQTSITCWKSFIATYA